MKYILAIDSFKGCMTSDEAETAAAEAISAIVKDAETVCVPVSDGGEGMLDAFIKALGGRKETAVVHNPLMRRITAEYGITADGTAVIEMAAASGLNLIDKEERNPMRTTTFGTGELVAAAVMRGCRKFIIGLGGSATSDAGMGMLMALKERLAPKAETFDEVQKGVLGECSFTLACDVKNPLCGENGAAAVYGPQKGATPEMVKQLDERARRFAEKSAAHFGFDCSNRPGAGAAGGLGYAFMQYLGAEMQSGADLLLDMVGFNDMLNGACCVITGEGRADRQTLMGKLPFCVMSRAKQKGVPVWLLAGRADDADELKRAGFTEVESITPEGMSLNEAMQKDTARQNMTNAINRLLAGR